MKETGRSSLYMLDSTALPGFYISMRINESYFASQFQVCSRAGSKTYENSFVLTLGNLACICDMAPQIRVLS